MKVLQVRQPVLTIDNIPATETIENGTYTFTGTYIQQEGEILNSYQYTLYDSNKNVLSKTPLIYYETDSSLSYTFVGMSNDTSYYIELSGETVNGTHITSGVIYFTVRYIQPASFAICDLVNNCDDGYIQVSSNIVAIDGKSNPDPPIYIDDKEVDLRDPDSWVEWDSGFRIQDDFTLRAWGRDFNPYEPIITLKNDIDTPQTPNKIEMKWMTGDVIKNLPLYTSKSGNNINIIDSEAANIQNLTVGGNSVEDKDNITKLVIDGNYSQETQEGSKKSASGEDIHLTDVDAKKPGAITKINGNQYQATREGYNLLDFNVAQDSKVTVNEDGTITINGQGGFTLAFKQFTAKANTKYYIKWELVSGTVDTSKSGGNSFLDPLDDNKNIKQGEFKESIVESDKDIHGFWINNMAVFTNAVIKFWANTGKSDFVEHQSQSAIMPIQQEMLTGDYIKDVEHHEWKKIILTGNEPFYIDDVYHGIAQFTTQLPVGGLSIRDDAVRILSNYFKGVGYNNSWTIDNSVTILDLNNFRIMTSQYTTVKDFKAWLKSKYDEGNPVIVYYKLATPIDLELTEVQKEAKTKLTDMTLYQGVTNITNQSSYPAILNLDYNIVPQIPSPDYPSEIEVIDGVNRFDINKLKQGTWNNVYALQRVTIWVTKIDIGESYTIINYDTSKYNFSCGVSSSNGYNKSATASDDSGWITSSTYTITASTTGYLFIQIKTPTGKDIKPSDLLSSDFQITEGITPKPYLPHGCIGLEQSGKNKFDSSIFKTIVKDGVTLTNENGIITLNGTYTGTKDWNYIFNISTLNGEYILSMNQISGSQTLTGANGIRFTLWEQDYSNVWVSLESKFLNKTVKGHDYIRASLIVFPGTSFNNLKINLQVEEGTIATAYEPYHKSKIIPIDLQGNTLAKVGDVKDLLKIYRNGDVEIEKKIGKVVLDGSEKLVEKSSSTTRTYWGIDFSNYGIYQYDDSTKTCDILTTKFKSRPQQGLFLPGQVALMKGKKNVYFIFEPNTTEEQARTILKDMPVYFRLAEPQIITLPSISPIELWQGTNIFEPITNLSTTLETTYGYSSVGDIKNIINVSDFNITYNQAYYQDTNTNFKLQPNYLYTLSFDYNINSESTDLYFSIGYGTDSYKTNIASSIQYKTQNKGRNTISFIVPEEVSENDTLWVRFAQTIILANVNVDISNIQLEYGKKATDYQTPGLYNIYLTSAAKNLYNYKTPLYLQKNNVSYTEIQGGYEITPVIVDTPASLNIGWKSLLNPGDTYTVSYSQLGQFEDFKLYKTDKNSQRIISEIPLNNNTFVAPDGFYDLQLVFSVDSSSMTNHIDIWNIQIEASNVITTYDPYISNSSIITLEEPLRSSGEYRDLICLASPNLLNPANQSANVSGDEKYYLSQAGNVSYTLDFINEDNNKISSTVLTSGVFTTPDNCVKVQIGNVEAIDLTNNKVQINIGETAQVYYPYVTVPSLIRYCKEENGVISVLDTPIAYDLSANNQNALEVLTTYTPISNVFTNNTVLGKLYLDYVSGYSNQQTENAYVLLKCWNANKMPYVIHSNYIDIPSDYNKVFIWCRRKGNLFDLKIEDLGDYREHDKPIDTDKPVVELVVDKTGVTRTEIPVTATSIDNVGLRTVRFSKDNGATWDEIVPVDGLSSVNSYTFTGLTPDTTYTIRAEAIDLSGNIGGISENVTTLA